MAHNGTAAAAEFRKVLDHRGIVANFEGRNARRLASIWIARATTFGEGGICSR
jgi:hypothetical protein